MLGFHKLLRTLSRKAIHLFSANGSTLATSPPLLRLFISLEQSKSVILSDEVADIHFGEVKQPVIRDITTFWYVNKMKTLQPQHCSERNANYTPPFQVLDIINTSILLNVLHTFLTEQVGRIYDSLWKNQIFSTSWEKPWKLFSQSEYIQVYCICVELIQHKDKHHRQNFKSRSVFYFSLQCQYTVQTKKWWE